MKQLNWGMLSIILGTIVVWASIFTIGFFTTICYLIIIACIIGLIIKLRENRY